MKIIFQKTYSGSGILILFKLLNQLYSGLLQASTNYRSKDWLNFDIEVMQIPVIPLNLCDFFDSRGQGNIMGGRLGLEYHPYGSIHEEVGVLIAGGLGRGAFQLHVVTALVIGLFAGSILHVRLLPTVRLFGHLHLLASPVFLGLSHPGLGIKLVLVRGCLSLLLLFLHHDIGCVYLWED